MGQMMDPLGAGADIATMLTGLSVVTATYIWGQKQWREHQERKAAWALRDWHGYINPGGINAWRVRLVEDPDSAPGRVVLEVLNPNKGEPDSNQAHNFSQRVLRDGQLTRPPTPAEYAWLRALYKERGYGKGFPVE